MSNPLLISPSRETPWHFEAGEFVRLLLERWPGADIRLMAADNPFTTLDFELPLPGAPHPVDGSLAADGQAVWVRGDIPQGATVAEWIRSVVPAEQELVFCDQGYNFDVALVAGVTAKQIVAAVEAFEEP